MIILTKNGDMIEIPGIEAQDSSVLKLLAKSAPNLEVLAVVAGEKTTVPLRDLTFFRADETGKFGTGGGE